MTKHHHRRTFAMRVAVLILFFAAAAAPAPARAQGASSQGPGSARGAPVPNNRYVDIEIDPTAYALGGQSVHAGVGWNRTRASIGAFGLDLPRAFTGDDNFAVSFNGFDVGLQRFFLSSTPEPRGAFLGASAGVLSTLVQRRGTELASRGRAVNVGVSAGWRFLFGEHLYATPWLGVGYLMGGSTVILDGQTYHGSRVVFFPAVHLGYRFL